MHTAKLLISTAIIMSLTVGPAMASPTPVEAFECKLPYQQAMEAILALEIREKKTSRVMAPNPPLVRDENIAEFTPSQVRVFGQPATRLAVSIREPDRDTGKFEAQFIAEFTRDAGIDQAIQAGNKWHFGTCGELSFCIRAADGEANRFMEYRRETNRLKIACKYTLRASDFES